MEGRVAQEIVAERIDPLVASFGRETLQFKNPFAHLYFYDFVPDSAKRCSFYLLSDRLITRWQYDFKYSKEKSGAEGKWSEQESWRVDWAEPFHVHSTESGLLLVTESGRVFRATGSKEGERKIKEVRTALARQPLIALLVDSKRGQFFAFGKDFFFDVDKTDHVMKSQEIVSGSSKIGEPLGTLKQCARVLRKAQERGGSKNDP